VSRGRTLDAVDALVGEALAHRGFDADGVVGEEQRVDVKRERNEASPSSRMRSTGASGRVIPILIMPSGTAPTLEMT
jgi:hypothetical protein